MQQQPQHGQREERRYGVFAEGDWLEKQILQAADFDENKRR